MSSAGETPAALEGTDALFEAMTGLIRQPAELEGQEVLELMERSFAPSDRLTPQEQLGIYRRQFWLKHRDSLAEDFPATVALLGDAWEGLCREYLRAHPPRSRGLRELGFPLPEFLASAGMEPGLVDMARLERAYLEVFDAPDEAPLDSERALAVAPSDWPRVCLGVSGALRLLDVAPSVADRRRELLAGRKPEDAPREEGLLRLAVYRRDLDLWDQAIEAAPCELLRRLGQGLPLGVACAEVASLVPGAAAAFDRHMSEWFLAWARLGWITSVS